MNPWNILFKLIGWCALIATTVGIAFIVFIFTVATVNIHHDAVSIRDLPVPSIETPPWQTPDPNAHTH
jgi:hypothetical protein